MILRELFAVIGIKPEQTSFQKADGMIGSLKTALVGLGVTLTAGAIYKGLKGLVDSTYHAGYEARRAGERVGVAAAALQELKEAADDVGIHGGSVEQALRFVGRNASEAANGSGALQSAFKKLGVSVKDSSGHLRKADDLLMDLSDAFVAMPEAERPAAAMRLLGRTGGQMLPLLIKGKAGIAAMREEARATGLIMGEDALDAAQEYHKALDGLGDTAKGLKFSIGIPLLRIVAENMRALTGWIEKNRALIRDKVVEWVTRLVSILKVLMIFVHGAAEGVMGFVHWLREVSKESAALRVAFIALGLGIALALAPATVAIVGLLGVLEEIWGWVTGKRKTLLEDAMGPFAEWKKDPLGGIGDAVTRGLTSLYGGFHKLFDLKPGDSPFLAGLKTLLHIVTDLQGAWLELERAFKEGKLFRLLAQWAVGVNEAMIGGSPEGLLMKGVVAAMPESMTKRGPEDEAITDAVGALTPDLVKVAFAVATGMTARPAESAVSLPSWAGPPTTEAAPPGMSPVPTIPYLSGPAQEVAGPTFNFNFGDIVTPSPADFVRQVEPEVRRVLRQELGEAQTAGNR